MKKFIVIMIALAIASSTSLFAWVDDDVKVSGEINGWADGTMSKDTLGTEIWEVTIQATADDASMDYLYQNWSYGNKWTDADSTALDSVANVTFNGTTDDVLVNVVNGNYYTFRFLDSGYADSKGVVMETSAQPIFINSVTEPVTSNENQAVVVGITLSASKSAEENIYVRWTTNSWTSDDTSAASGAGTAYSASIPGMPHGTVVDYYVLSTTMTATSPLADADLVTLSFDNNGGDNYKTTVVVPEPTSIFLIFLGLGILRFRK